MSIFSQNGQLLLFWPKFGDLGQLREIWPHYLKYFGSNIVYGDAESWMEAEMSYLEVD